MIDIPQVISTMTPFPHSIDIGAPISAAIELMKEHNVHHLPVVAEHALVGLVTSRDIKTRMAAGTPVTEQSGLLVKDIYVDDPYIVDVSAPLDEVLQTMSERHISSTIVTKHGKLAGILTPLDVCRAFAAFLRDRYGGDDDVA